MQESLGYFWTVKSVTRCVVELRRAEERGVGRQSQEQLWPLNDAYAMQRVEMSIDGRGERGWRE